MCFFFLFYIFCLYRRHTLINSSTFIFLFFSIMRRYSAPSPIKQSTMGVHYHRNAHELIDSILWHQKCVDIVLFRLLHYSYFNQQITKLQTFNQLHLRLNIIIFFYFTDAVISFIITVDDSWPLKSILKNYQEIVMRS